MRLIIARHGDAEIGADDASRALSKEGRGEAADIGRALAKMREVPSEIWHSELLRAAQTARCAGAEMSYRGQYLERPGLQPGSDPEALARELDSLRSDASVMIVSHEPFVGLAVSILLTAGIGLSVKFTTGSFAILERRSSRGGWLLRAHMTAKAARRLVA